MSISLVREYYLEAKKQWPNLEWDFDSFRMHHARFCKETTAHHRDMFLAGAVGYRVQTANDYLHRDYSDRLTRVLAHAAGMAQISAEDVWPEVFAKVIDEHVNLARDEQFVKKIGMKPARLVDYAGVKELGGYLIHIGANFITSEYRKRRCATNHARRVAMFKDVRGTGGECRSRQSDKKMQTRMDRDLQSIVAEMSEAEIIYCSGCWNEGVSQKDIALQYGNHSAATVNRCIKRVCKRLEVVLGEWSLDPDARAATLQMLGKFKKSLKLAASEASKDAEGMSSQTNQVKTKPGCQDD